MDGTTPIGGSVKSMGPVRSSSELIKSKARAYKVVVDRATNGRGKVTEHTDYFEKT